MFEQDYIIKMIKEMIRAILKLTILLKIYWRTKKARIRWKNYWIWLIMGI